MSLCPCQNHSKRGEGKGRDPRGSLEGCAGRYPRCRYKVQHSEAFHRFMPFSPLPTLLSGSCCFSRQWRARVYACPPCFWPERQHRKAASTFSVPTRVNSEQLWSLDVAFPPTAGRMLMHITCATVRETGKAHGDASSPRKWDDMSVIDRMGLRSGPPTRPIHF